MFKRLICFVMLGAVIMLTEKPANSETGNRSSELGRPIRVLASGVSDLLLKQTSDLNGLDEIDFDYPSNKLSDFDMMLVFVDEFQEASTMSLVEQLGVGDELLPREGEDPFMISLHLSFAELENKFPLYVIDRRQFYARDLSCHAPFLRDIILEFDGDAVVRNEANYRTASECIKN